MIKPDKKAEDLIKLTNRLFNSSERKNAEGLWAEISEFILPNQTNVFSDNATETKGGKRTQRLYDSTAIQANSELAAIIHSIMTSPNVKWAALAFEEEDMANDDSAKEWLDDTVNRIHSAINASNFDIEAATGYNFYVSIGNEVLMVEELDQKEGGKFVGLTFKNWHLSEVVFTENKYGEVDSCYRKFEFTGRQAYETWGDKLDEEMKEAYEREPEKKFCFIHCIHPRMLDDIKQTSLGGYVRGGEPYASIYIDVKNKKILDESGYIEFPACVARLEKGTGEVYGRGLGTKALPDIKTLNRYVKVDLQAKSLAAMPPILAEQRALIGPLDVRPGATLILKDINRTREYITGTRFDVNIQGIEMLRASIRQIFMLDKLILPPRDKVGEMTAFEIAQRRVDIQRIAAPIAGRIHAELIGPLIKRVFGIMLRGGALKDPPRSIRGRNIKVIYVNPLSRSQNAEDLTAINQWMQTAAALSQLGRTDALDHFNVDEIMKNSAKILNVPQICQETDKKIEESRAARAKIMQAQAQLEAGTKTADMQAKMSKANQNNSNGGGPNVQ